MSEFTSSICNMNNFLGLNSEITKNTQLSLKYTFKVYQTKLWSWFIVLNATFNNISDISWRSILLVEETGVPGVNHRPVAIH